MTASALFAPPIAVDLFDLVADSVVATGSDGKILAWNRAAECLYGRPRAQAIGMTYEEMFGEGLPEELTADEANHAEAPPEEVCRRSACGREVTVRLRRVRRVDADGGPSGWLELGTDLTSLRRAERAELANRLHYENVFQAIPVGVCFVDFSQAHALLLQWLEGTDLTADEWLSARLDKVRELMDMTYVLDINYYLLGMYGTGERTDMLTSVSPFWPDESVPDFKDWVVDYLSGNHHFSRGIRQRRLDGGEFDSWFTSSFAPGTVHHGRFIVTVMDYTELKRKEATLRRSEAFYTDMFHRTAFSAWRLDASGAQAIFAELRQAGVTDLRDAIGRDAGLLARLTDAVLVIDLNETSVRLFEGESRTGMIGLPITPFWPADALEPLVGGLEATFLDLETFRSTAAMRTLGGRRLEVLLTLSSSGARHEAGELLLAVVDMTDKVQAENALAEARTALAHAARVSSLGELTASIAHEVKQPLAAMTANGGALLRWLARADADPAEIQRLVGSIIADARRASDVVAHVRALASPQAGKHHLLSLTALVAEAMRLLDVQLRREGVATVLALPPSLPSVMGDKVQLQQVVVNLVLNAAQAMGGRDQPRLNVMALADGADVMLVFEDNGPGIPEEDLDRLFGSFFTTKPDGMGIGLAICRTIVESHGGSISVGNASGEGARFEVRLPRARASIDAA